MVKASPGQPPLPDPDQSTLEQLIRQLVADAWIAGDHAAGLQIGPDAALTVSGDVNWSQWKPGSPAAADLTTNGGLADLLDDAGVTIRGVIGTALDQAGNLIGRGLAAGDSVDTIARSLRGMLGDPFRAERVAHTETARAMSLSSLNTYEVNGIGRFDVITADNPCEEICVPLAELGPYPVAEGDAMVPGHPLCRCAIAPSTTA